MHINREVTFHTFEIAEPFVAVLDPDASGYPPGSGVLDLGVWPEGTGFLFRLFASGRYIDNEGPDCEVVYSAEAPGPGAPELTIGNVIQGESWRLGWERLDPTSGVEDYNDAYSFVWLEGRGMLVGSVA